jgi:nucleoside permease NupC
VPLAMAARLGNRPKRDAISLVRPLAWLMGVSAVLALAAGIAGWTLASLDYVQLVGYMAHAVPHDRHVAFLADGFAHTASYAAGIIGGLVVIVQVWRSRNVAQAQAPVR